MENRKSERLRTGDEVLFAIDSVVRRGMMVDLSTEGCRIAYDEQLDAVGAVVEVTLIQGIHVNGIVEWTKDDQIGVKFDKTLSDATLTYFRLSDWVPAQSAPPTDNFGRPLPPLPSGGFR